MTTNEKFSLLRSRGRKWAEISAFLGVSRQFLSEVRNGRKKLSEEKERLVDDFLEDSNRNQGDNRNQDRAHVADRETPYTAGKPKKPDEIERRLDALELDMKLVKQMMLNRGLLK